jgi:hypothetical protein
MKNMQTGSKLLKAMDLLRIGGFRTSGFSLTTSVLVHVGGGLFVHGVLDEVMVPTEIKDLQQNCLVARAMLKMKVKIFDVIILLTPMIDHHRANYKLPWPHSKRDGEVEGTEERKYGSHVGRNSRKGISQ